MISNLVNISEKANAMSADSRREYFYEKLHAGRPEDNVAVIIDGANLGQIAKSILRQSVDYHKLNLMLRENYPGLRMVEFVVTEFLTRETPLEASNGKKYPKGYSSIRALLDYLKNNRYKVNSRAVYVESTINGFANDSDYDHQMDVEITTALYKASRYANHIVFIGGNQKYYAPLIDLREQGITITVIGVKKPDPNDKSKPVNIKARYTADELRGIDNFVDLSDPFFECILKPLKPLKPNLKPEAFSTLDQDENNSNLVNS